MDLIRSAKESNLIKLDLSGRGISEIPKEIYELNQIKILSLDRNDIWEIPDDIKKLTSLEVLDLSHNQLVIIPKVLDELPNLKFIETVGNPVKGSGIMPKVVSLTKEVEERIQAVKSKRKDVLNLAGCGLTVIPKEVFELKNLKSLILGKSYEANENVKHRNFITDIPEAIQQLTSLEILDLSGNALSNLPHYLEKLTSLKTLILCQNQFRKVSRVISKLGKELTELDFSKNDIAAIPDAFSVLKNVEKLNLSYNGFRQFPQAILKLSSLKELNISHNQIKELPNELSELSTLQHLDASYNQIKYLPTSFAQLSNLKKANLSHNQLVRLEGNIHHLRFGIEELNVSNNQLKAFPVGLRHLLKLQSLDASYNQLTEISSDLFVLHQLQKLDLNHNKIKELPIEITQLKALEEIDFTFNDFNKALVRPIKQGMSGIRDWFNYQKAIEICKTAKDENLDSVDISDLNLRSIPRDVFNLPQLKTLIIGKSYNQYDDANQRNKIAHLTKSINKLTNLEVLIAPNNELSEFPEELVELSNLKVLDLSYNQIKELPANICKMKALTYLNLNHNLLQKLPYELTFLNNLEEVHWNLNPFQSPFKETMDLDFRSMRHWLSEQLVNEKVEEAVKSKAIELDLSNLNISTLPKTIFKIKTLKRLNVSNNQITEIPEEIGYLNRLESLNLEHNQLKSLPTTLARLRKLKNFTCEANPFDGIPQSVCRQDIENIQQWLLQQDINKKIDHLLSNSVEESPVLYKKGIVVCQVCEGKQNLTGYNPHINIQFYNHTCYGCNGVGKIQYDAEHLHLILNDAQIKIQQVEGELRKIIQQKKNFEQSMLFSVAANSPLHSKQVRKNHLAILNRYNSNLRMLSQKHDFYKNVQNRLHNVLYHQYLLYCAMDEFRKLDHLEAGLSLNFEEKAALQKDIVHEVSSLNDYVENSNGLAIPADFIHAVSELSDRFKAIL